MNEEASTTQTITSFRAGLFGILTIEQEGKPSSLTASPSIRIVLAYLLLHGQQPQTRMVLADRLWPDAPEARGRSYVRHALWLINRSLPGLLKSDRNTICISPQAHLWTDVAEFNGLLKPLLTDAKTVWSSQDRAELQRAIRLYQGDLLEEYYKDWILVERERLYELYLRALEREIQVEKLAGDYQQALTAAQTLAGLDPLKESAHREVMRINHRLNRPKAALDQYAVCRRILADRMGVQPEPETARVAQEIAAGSERIDPAEPRFIGSSESSPLTQLPLVGRRDERAELIQQVEHACQGRLGAILVEGEAGVGKTRLLQEVARDARWRGAEVLWGKGKELEASGPYGPLLEVLNSGLSPLRAGQIAGLLRDNLSGSEQHQDTQDNEIGTAAGHEPQAGEAVRLQVLGSLIPVLASELPDAQASRPAPLEPDQEHMRLVEALSHLLLAWSRITPLILILEDLHWADRDTLDTLIHLVEQLPVWSDYAATTQRQSQSGGLLILGSYRGEEARSQPELWGQLQRLDRLGLHERLVLSRLDAAATGELVRHSLGTGQLAPLFEARLYTETVGNPLFVLETLRYLYGEELLWRDEGGGWNTPFDETTTDYAELPLSPVIEGIIARRLAQLASEHRLVLDAAAVLGCRFEFSLLAAVTDLDAAVLLGIMSDLVQQGFVDEHEQDYQFHHDKVRLVVYEGLDEKDRIGLHCRVAQTIEETQPKQVEALAHHCTSGEMWDKAVHYHRLAAEAAQSAHTYSMALEHLDAAIKHLDRSSMEEEHYQLLEAREVVLDVLGKRDAQAADLEAMLELAHDDQLQQTHVQCRRAELLANLGRFNEADAAAHQALDIAERSGCESSQVAALIALDFVSYAQGQLKRAVACLHQADKISWEEVDLSLQARARHMMARTLMESQLSMAQTEAQAALALYERLQDQCGQAKVLITLGVFSTKQSVSEDAISYYSQALQVARQIGYRLVEAAALTNLVYIFYSEDRFARALEIGQEAQLIFRILGHSTREHSMRVGIATIRCSILGDVDTDWDDLQAAVAVCKARELPVSGILGTLGGIARCRGDLKTARAYLEESLAGVLSAGEIWLAIEIYTLLIQLELDDDHLAMALEYLETAEELCQDVGMSSWGVKMLELRGLVMLALGQPQKALKATSRAMEQLRAGPGRSYLIPFRHFQALSALGRTQEAHEALEQSYRMLSEALSGFTPEQQKTSWERVPEHRAIRAAWLEIDPSPSTVHLPRIDAPTGRPLHNDESVEVYWTPTEVEDEKISNKVARRHKRILRLLCQAEEQGAAPTVDDLAKALDVSKKTIKRDLTALRRVGHSVKTRGHRGNR